MKLTKEQLKRIIKEELGAMMAEEGRPHVGEWIVTQLTKPYGSTSAYDDASGMTTPISQMAQDPNHGALVKDELMAAAELQGYSHEEFLEYWETAVDTAQGQ